MKELEREFKELRRTNMQVFSAGKVWWQLAREGMTVARCTVKRLMRKLGTARGDARQGRTHKCQ